MLGCARGVYRLDILGFAVDVVRKLTITFYQKTVGIWGLWIYAPDGGFATSSAAISVYIHSYERYQHIIS